MRRIIIHWTAGRNSVSAVDRKHYHFIIDGAGAVVEGIHKPEANLDTSTPYAAHTRQANTGAIGVALAAMHGAKERPFDAGKSPITKEQLAALYALCWDLCQRYGIPVNRSTVLTHAEVEPTLGIKQRGKWDITWLPGMAKPDDPIKVGDRIRAGIMAQSKPPAPPAAPMGFWARLFSAIFGGRK